MPAKRQKPVIAAQLYTLREYLKTPDEIAKTLKRVRQIGYDAAQISGVGPIAPADLRKLMLDAGVEPIGAHVGLDDFRADVDKVIADCQAWGVGYVAIPWLSHKACTTAAAWKQLFKEFEGYARKLARAGLVLQYHNHMFEFEKFGIKNGKGGTTILDMLFSGTRLLQAELDIGWIVRGGHDPIAWIRRLAGRLDQVHLKDWGVFDNQPVWRAIGEGGIAWPAVLKACRQAGTHDFIVEQDDCPITKDPFLSLKISRANLRAMGLG
ncbi:MAG: sugar phosphate isomerase/epimerase [Kiritimatiellae bacterium]|nr:sugar phosphate isomerase/epimerase [Kiritimatiellia bacterium]